MFDFKSTVEIESSKCPGVKFTIRKPTQGRRAKLHLSIASVARKQQLKLQELNKLRVKYEEILEDGTKEEKMRWSDEDAALQIMVESQEIEIIELTPAYVRWGLVSVSGLAIDDFDKIDADVLLEHGPEELIEEIKSSIKANLGLTEENQKNLQLPSTSPEAVGKTPKPTIANTARVKDYGAVALETEDAAVSAI